MISGQLPNVHKITTHSRSFDSLPQKNTIFDDLEEYRTVGISGNIYAGPTYDFDDYFDSFYELKRGVRFPRALSPYSDSYDMSLYDVLSYMTESVKSDRSIKSVLNGFTALLDQFTDVGSWAFDQGAKSSFRIAHEELRSTSAPTFIFLNLMESHIHYQPAWYLNSDLYNVPSGWSSDEKGVWELFRNEYDEKYWNKRNQLYRATIDYLDRRISKFVQSVGEDASVIITADHGDNLGTDVDDGLANHKSSLSEGVLHVPLCIINAPTSSKQTGDHTSHLFLPDLIKGLQQGYIPDLTSDRVFSELGGMSAGPDPESDYEYYNRAIRCAYNNDEKIVWDSFGNCVKYLLDPTIMNYQQHSIDLDQPPSWARDRFSCDIDTFKSEIVKNEDEVDIDTSTAQRLEELGYL
jgi:hypothetical protein